MQWILAALVNILISILESSFKKDPRNANRNFNEDDSDDADFFSSSSSSSPFGKDPKNDQEKRLRLAYEFMELKTPVSLEQVRKKYKQLSLRYHPDRNGGSPESHEQMQKLNACFALIETDLQTDNNGSESENESSSKTTTPEEQRAELRRRHQEMEKQRRKMQEQMKREMEEEMRKYREERKQFLKLKRKDKGRCHRKLYQMGLNTEEGRKQAYATFQKEIQERQQEQQEDAAKKPQKDHQEAPLDDIDDDRQHKDPTEQQQQQQHDSSDPNKKKKTQNKPQNHVMDCNVDDIVVAMRLGFPDVALGVMEEEINTYIQRKTKDVIFSLQHRQRTSISLAPFGIEFLSRPLDFDDNTLLHYATYYRCYQVVNAVCGTALNFGGLATVLERLNKYGQTAWAFAQIVAGSSDDDDDDDVDDGESSAAAIRQLLKNHLDMVQAQKVDTQVIPALRAALSRGRDILVQMDVAATFSTLLAFGIGRQLFDLHTITSVVGVIVMQYLGKNDTIDAATTTGAGGDTSIAEVTMLFSFLVVWKSASLFLRLIYPYILMSWEFLLLLTPFLIAVWVSSSSRKRHGTGRGGGGGSVMVAAMVDLVLYPLSLQAWVAHYLERWLTALDHHVVTPKKLMGQYRLDQPFWLILLGGSLSLGIQCANFLSVR